MWQYNKVGEDVVTCNVIYHYDYVIVRLHT